MCMGCGHTVLVALLFRCTLVGTCAYGNYLDSRHSILNAVVLGCCYCRRQDQGSPKESPGHCSAWALQYCSQTKFYPPHSAYYEPNSRLAVGLYDGYEGGFGRGAMAPATCKLTARQQLPTANSLAWQLVGYELLLSKLRFNQWRLRTPPSNAEVDTFPLMEPMQRLDILKLLRLAG